MRDEETSEDEQLFLRVMGSLEAKNCLFSFCLKNKTKNRKQTRKNKAASDETYPYYLCYGYPYSINISTTRNQFMKNLENIH